VPLLLLGVLPLSGSRHAECEDIIKTEDVVNLVLGSVVLGLGAWCEGLLAEF